METNKRLFKARLRDLWLFITLRAEEFEGFVVLDSQPMHPAPRGQNEFILTIVGLSILIDLLVFAFMWHFDAPRGAYGGALAGMFIPLAIGLLFYIKLASANWKRFKRRHPDRVETPNKQWRPYRPFEVLK